MDIESLRQHCLHKKAVTEEFPFDNDTLVFKVLGKMFALVPLEQWESGKASISLKCDPDYNEELKAQYDSIGSGPYLNNKHWNRLAIHTGELKPSFIFELIDHSYDMVVKGMTRKLREEFDRL